MIAELGLTGVLFTADALHGQKKPLSLPKPAATHCSSRSRPTSQLDTLHAIAAIARATDRFESVARNRHGRQEHRLVETFDVTGKLAAEWDDLIGGAARITRLTWHKDTQSGFWHETEEVSFYICQVPLGAQAFGHAVRNHWAMKIEAITFATSRSVKTIAEPGSSRCTSPGSAASPSTSCAPMASKTSPTSSMSTRLTSEICWHTQCHSEN
jgi:predicted transposase YbfD/YdcC